jgi:membrane-associated protease RseP (regulator of RpoE activity)
LSSVDLADPPASDPNDLSSGAVAQEDHYEQFIPKPLPPPHGRVWVQMLLLALTLVTTTVAGALHYFSFSTDLATSATPTPSGEFARAFSDPIFYLRGLWYSLTILAILGCHEMGHYVACLRYNVMATRPYFLPVPPIPFMTGTLGAFIRIKSRIPDKVALFDIGIAGPIAGFIVAVPLLFVGLALSRVDRLPDDSSMLIELGEPLLFRGAAWLIWGDVASGYSINMHPMAFAAWFGLLATALNLFPISQLDGGHIAYAVFGRRSTIVTFIMIGVAIGLTFVSSSWILWTALTVVMIAVMGPHHPPTLDDDRSLDTGRLLLAAVALAMLILCFTPAPIGPFLGTS